MFYILKNHKTGTWKRISAESLRAMLWSYTDYPDREMQRIRDGYVFTLSDRTVAAVGKMEDIIARSL